MATFKIVFEQEFYEANSPLDAAKNVLKDIINGETLCFTVINEDTGEQFLS